MYSDDLYKSIKSHIRKRKAGYFLTSLIISAAAIRIWFYSGLIFSDDAYYDQLAFSLLRGEYGNDYIGYPGFLLRIQNHFLTAVSFFVFGANEAASVIPSFLFSILSIPLIYKTSFLINADKKTAAIAAFLWVLFPVDIIFASINFAEPKCAFFLNLGAYLLLKSELQNKIKLAWLSGVAFYASLLLKEYFFFFSILLIVLLLYYLAAKRQFRISIFISLAAFGCLFLAHSLYYLINENDFFYYFTILKENFRYAYYDFFPASAAKVFGDSDYFTLLIQQLLLNIKYIFLRRHNVGLPLLGLILSIVSFVKRRNLLSAYWFLGLSIIFIAFTTSFTIYAPLDLYNMWYAYPLFFPLFLLLSVYAVRLNKKALYILGVLYIVGGIYISYQYKVFFDVDNKKDLKEFVNQNTQAEIYTDHHTKYAVDLIRSYENTSKIINLNMLKEIPKNSLIIYNKDVINELIKQGHKYSESTDEIEQNNFVFICSYGHFEIYKKI